MKTLHLLKTSVGGTWALRQIRELVNLGVKVHVALPGGGPMVGKYAEAGATEHILQTDFPIRCPWQYPLISNKFLSLVKTIRPDVIHSHFVGTTLTMRFTLGKNSTIPRIFQVPGPLHLEHTFFKRAEIATSGRSDFWVGSCRWTCKSYEQLGIDPKRIFLSYYGTDIDTYTSRKEGKLRKELGLSSACKIIGMVAYMYAPKRYLGQKRGLKGHEDLIDAIKICLKDYPQLYCVIVGGAWNNAIAYEKFIHAYARQKCGDRIVFLGTRNDIPDIYSDIDIAVHPSHSENVGGAIESCLSGVPTIATKVGGFPDLIQDGVTGWLVPVNDPQAIATAILDILKNDAEARKKAQAGQELARRMFDVRKTAAEIKIIYEKVLNRI